MNKTLTINLSGLVFHIDENAYDVLRGYLEKLKRRFTGNSGEEIITDIEARIAEMFQEKISPAKNVITLDDVNSVISIMGNPEDIAAEDPGQTTSEQGSTAPYATTRKRLYRNPDDKMLAGVCGGIGAYFDIDPVWLRLAFVLAVVILGTGIFLYIILWIVIPMAKTASEKLEMRGEAVNVSNIEKNIKAEMENVKEQVSKLGSKIKSEETRQHVKNFADRTGGAIKDVFGYILKFVLGIIGFIVSAFSILLLIGLTALIFSAIGWIPSLPGDVSHNFFHYIVSPHSLWILLIGIILLTGIPLVILMLNGIKLLFRIKMDLRRVGAIMLGFWLIGIVLCTWQGILIANQFSKKASISQTEILPAFKNRTVHLGANKIASSRFEWRDDEDDRIEINGGFLSFTNKPDSIMCNNIRLTIDQSRTDSVYLIRTYNSRGASTPEANELAENIKYAYSQGDSNVVLNNAFSILHEEKYRAQGVRLTLKIPVGYKLIIDKSMKELEYEASNLSDLSGWDMSGHSWLMTRDGLKCLDCADKNMKTDNEENNSGNNHLHNTKIKLTIN